MVVDFEVLGTVVVDFLMDVDGTVVLGTVVVDFLMDVDGTVVLGTVVVDFLMDVDGIVVLGIVVEDVVDFVVEVGGPVVFGIVVVDVGVESPMYHSKVFDWFTQHSTIAVKLAPFSPVSCSPLFTL